MIQRRLLTILLAALLMTALTAAVKAEERLPAPAGLDKLLGIDPQLEKDLLQIKAMQLEAVKSIGYEFLRRKKLQKLKDIVGNLKVQRQTTRDFEGFFKWMSTNLAGYNRYIQASSYVASAAKMLPVPYAGQASNFTKFAGQFTVTINKASVSTTQYLVSSQKLIAMVEAINPALPLSDKALDEAHLFADQKVLKDMNDAQKNLSAISDLSSGALSFLTGLAQFANETTGYWHKVKGLVKDVDPKEKSYLPESISYLKSQAERFNGRFTLFEELAEKETAGVKSYVVYNELAAEISVMK